MKIAGKKIQPPKPIEVVIYREDGDISFQCGAVLSYELFDQICPIPKAPLKTNVQTSTSYHDETDPRYKERLDNWGKQKTAWMIVQSLATTNAIEWETVDLGKPDTLLNYRKELEEVLTQAEIGRLIDGVVEANSPSDSRRKEAMENFTLTPEEQAVITSYRAGEHTNIVSSEPAKD